MNLKRKMTVAVSALMVAFAAVLACVILGYFERNLHQNISAQQLSIITYIANEVDNTLLTAQRLLVANADGFPLAALDSPAEAKQFLSGRTGLNRLFNDQMMVIAASGDLVAATATDPGRRIQNNFTDEPFFKETLKTGKPLISDLTTCCDSYIPSEIVLTAPIHDRQGAVRGVMVGSFSLKKENILSRFSSLKIGKEGYLQLISSDRTILLHPSDACLLRHVSPALDAVVEDALHGFIGTRETVNNLGQSMLTTVRKLTIKDWVLASNYPVAEAYEPIRAARIFLGVSTALGVVGVIVLVTILMRRLTRPLTVFAAHIKGLPTKSGDARFLAFDTGDEIAELSAEFNEMVKCLDSRTESLQESEERFRSTFEQAAVGIAHVGMDGRFTRVNHRFCEILGYADGEMNGMTFMDITFPEDLERYQTCREHLLEGAGSCATDNRYHCKDGSMVWVTQTGSLIMDREGRPKYFIAVIEDISARKAAEDEIRRLNAELEERVIERTAQLEAANESLRREIVQRIQAQDEICWLNDDLERQKRALEMANRELEAFSYSVSHDLQAPLRHVAGFGQVLLEDYGCVLDDDGRQVVQRMQAATSRMGQLIDALLNLSRLSRGQLKRERVDLGDMAREIIGEFRLAEPERQVTVTIGTGLKAIGDGSLLRIVLENLLSNAWKYTGKRKQARIEVGALIEDDSTVFFVRDNGAGFDMAYAERLFGPFQRLHRREEFEGTGVGLATVQRIIHRHGGRIWAESQVGKGAVFYFTL